MGKQLQKRQRGFTLLETIVAMAIISLISMIVLGALSPWMNFKQKLDTERKMQDVKQGFIALYDAKGFELESAGAGVFAGFTDSALTPNAQCAPQDAAFAANSNMFAESGLHVARDGYSAPWCIRISAPIKEVVDGADLWYRNIYIISSGLNGLIDAGTTVNAQGVLVVAGDDLGLTISGRDVQNAKLQETLRRMNRVAQVYETFFTARYLGNPSRDINKYYFAEPGGPVTSPNTWVGAYSMLSNIGVTPTDGKTPWEKNNFIDVNTGGGAVNGISARSPATTGTGMLPYTAVLRAQIPAPNNAANYVVRVVVGTY